jgi:hypothetical protein
MKYVREAKHAKTNANILNTDVVMTSGSESAIPLPAIPLPTRCPRTSTTEVIALATTPGNSKAITTAPWIPIPNAAKPKRIIYPALCWVWIRLLVMNHTKAKANKKIHSINNVITILLRHPRAVIRSGAR